MKFASSLVALATVLSFTSALAASELTTSSGQPVGSTYQSSISVNSAEPSVAPAEKQIAPEQKAPVKKTKKKSKKTKKIIK